MREAFLGRVVDLGDHSVLVGVHAQPLGPIDAARVVDDVRRTLRTKLPIPIERLRGEGEIFVLATLWHRTMEERRMAPLPQLRNSDGDLIRFVADRYRFAEPACGAVESALTSIRGADEIETQEDGTRIVSFLKEKTVVGTAFIGRDELRIETNSRRRAAALRKKVENRCGELLTNHERSETDPLDALGEEYHDSMEPELSAEEAALIRAEKAKHYADWRRTPLPFLGGRTPRQAVRSQRGRERVALLLKQLERDESNEPEETRFDFAVLRRELGIVE